MRFWKRFETLEAENPCILYTAKQKLPTLCMEKQRSFRKGNEQNVPGGKEIFKPMKTGWTDKFEFAFAHKDKLCSPLPKEGPRPLGAL